jgi:hypothetical protein
MAVHVYHLWLGGAWQHIADRHFTCLRAAEFTGRVLVGLVGAAATRAAARAQLPYEILVEADTGFEDVTLNALRERIRLLPGDTPVLYAHNKGAFHDIPENRLWRLYMTEHLGLGWRGRIRELLEHDVAAWHWVTAGSPDPFGKPLSRAIAPGNFWWARADYLKGLPALPALTEDTRMEAECWVGQDDPVVACLSSSWPKVVLQMWESVSIGGMQQSQPRLIWNPDFDRA